MTRTFHDQFAKHLLAGLLNQVGRAEPQHEIPGEVRAADLWFVARTVPQERRALLGWLGRMATQDCLIEAFSSTLSDGQIRDCLGKLFDLHRALRRKARRERLPASRTPLPSLWVLSPWMSQEKLRSFGASAQAPGQAWPEGVYFMPRGLNTAIVVLNQLPRTRETLFLRLLGKGKTWEEALDTARALPIDHPGRRLLLGLLHDGPTKSRRRSMRMTKDDVQWLKESEELYKALEADLIQQGQRTIVQSLLKARFGAVDPKLEAIVEPLLALPEDELGQEILARSREELLARFAPPSPRAKRVRAKK